MITRLALALLCIASPCWAQTAPAAAASAADTVTAPALKVTRSPILELTTESPDRAEPNVRHILVEDQGSKIEELRVRGRTEHIVVTPKVGTTKPYEILIAPGGRDLTEGTGGARSAVGKRVWSVLSF